MSSYVHNPMKNLYSSKYQIISLVFFAVFFISLFFPWQYAPGVKIRPGTLILSSLFPIGILAVAVFIIINIITIAKANKLYLHIINLTPLVVLFALSIRMHLHLDEAVGIAFYVSIISLMLSFVFCLVNIILKIKGEVTKNRE